MRSLNFSNVLDTRSNAPSIILIPFTVLIAESAIFLSPFPNSDRFLNALVPLFIYVMNSPIFPAISKKPDPNPDTFPNIGLSILALTIRVCHLKTAFHKEQEHYKYASYAWLIIALYFTKNLFENNLNLVYYVIPISTIIIYLIDRKVLNNKNYDLFLLILLISSYISLIEIQKTIAS